MSYLQLPPYVLLQCFDLGLVAVNGDMKIVLGVWGLKHSKHYGVDWGVWMRNVGNLEVDLHRLPSFVPSNLNPDLTIRYEAMCG
jgi:hypothetical protein